MQTARGLAPYFDVKKLSGLSMACALTFALSGCGETTRIAGRGFSPSEYGVAASARVVAMGEPVPKGGGIYRLGNPYQVRGKWYYPEDRPGYTVTGTASWYGDDFHGRKTANGEIYNMYALSAAHPTLPLPSYARVTNATNGRSVVVRINDRGPYHSNRVIDLSKRAATLLGMHDNGLGRVKVNYIGKAPLHGRDDTWLSAQVMENGVKLSRQQVAMLAPVPAWAQADPGQNDIRVALQDVLPQEDKPQVQNYQVQNSYAVASLRDVAPPTVAADERIGAEAFEEDQATQSIQTAAAGAPLALLPTSAVMPMPAVQNGGTASALRQAVQVGTFQDAAQAVRYRNALNRFGAANITMSKIDGITMYQVRVGPFGDAAQAEIALREARLQGATGAQLVRM